MHRPEFSIQQADALSRVFDKCLVNLPALESLVQFGLGGDDSAGITI